jgi:NAD(P)-dependent dehydrogenase (short-subunit alcohol dehydrogenase family)
VELKGTCALVTGGAVRLGRAVVLGLAEAGCDLVLHYGTSASEAAATAAEAESRGDPGAAAGLIGAAGDLGPVRVLVNGAAAFPSDDLAGLTVGQWDWTMAVNLRAPVLLTRAFAAALPEEMEGAVVNLSDWRTARPYRDHLSYTVAKGGLETFTRAAAEALAPRIRVNALALGAILPPADRDYGYLKDLAREIPAGRPGGTDPVVAAVLFLLRNPFITGEILRVNGGAHLR